jgi:hypothetical protein
MIATFVFYNKASGPQACLGFSREFKHCNVLTYDGDHTVMIEFVKQGIMPRVYKTNDIIDICKRMRMLKSVSAIVTVHIDGRPVTAWTPLWIKSCNELNRYVSGVDVGMTFNPKHLYKKLLKYDGSSNFKIDYHWRRKSKNGNV